MAGLPGDQMLNVLRYSARRKQDGHVARAVRFRRAQHFIYDFRISLSLNGVITRIQVM
jgi:hypothetical protein